MYGYYIFLGRGDFCSVRHPEEWALDARWTTTWDLETWKARIDFMVDRLGADTISILMNGFDLAYPSERFPEAVETDHPNVTGNLLDGVLDYAKSRGMMCIATLCTTGHARSYAEAHPDYTIRTADGQPHPQILCHHHPKGRAYADGMTEEVLTRYTKFDGIQFHPPEGAHPCRCPLCRKAFEESTGQRFSEASEQMISDFYWASCLAFQREMEAFARTLQPGIRIFTFTIPGQFEKDFHIVAKTIPQSTTIMHWDYWSYDEAQLRELQEAIHLYQSAGHPVAYTPTSGYNHDLTVPGYGDKVVRQMDAVAEAGVQDFIYFLGPIWEEEALLNTSWKLRR